MRNQYPFFKIKRPEGLKILREILKKYKNHTFTKRSAAAFLLYKEEERECYDRTGCLRPG